MLLRSHRTAVSALLLVAASFTAATAQQQRPNGPVSRISTNILLPIMRAEDERRWDQRLAVLLGDKNAKVRKRAALAAGRIGDERAVPALISLLRGNDDVDVRQMAAFALGEIESSLSADALIEVLDDTKQPGEVRARVVEALGKIAAALPKTEDARRLSIGQVILNGLAAERKEGATTAGGVRDRQFELLGLTAVLRARPADAGKVVTMFLSSADLRIRADAANTLARLRAKDGLEDLRQLLVTDQSPISRANAARALGAAEDKQAFDALLDRALHDDDLRVRVSAIRALGSLKDAKATESLLRRSAILLKQSHLTKANRPGELDELLELVSTVGNLMRNTQSAQTLTLFRSIRLDTQATAPEVETAFARVAPNTYLNEDRGALFNSVMPEQIRWRALSSLMQGYRELATAQLSAEEKRRVEDATSYDVCIKLRKGGCANADYAVPAGLRAYAAFKPADLAEVLREQFKITWHSWGPVYKPLPAPTGIYAVPSFTGYDMPADVIIRATAAELLGDLAPNAKNTTVLLNALPVAFHDDLNDAVLAILDALAKQKSKEANDAIKTALDSPDHLVRRRAVALLKANGVGDFSNRIGTVKTRNTEADYRRAIARIGKHVTATLVTSKGSFVIEFLPEDAPLTVDNFVQLARKGYFNGITFHRVVPNFVIQGGDPRGDGNGGPGYSIRCEINEVPYERAAVGMALSGKDTGGSQWFVTHSPQPHLDGGYTVFGRVIRGMEVVDKIARGDTIQRVVVSER
jgi:cyclophilin family peptidyl-prolyl cis-trans isomerase/HEAT repeat protein